MRNSIIATFLPALTAMLLLTSSSAPARILNVPDDYQTIQAGIDASEDGDTVLVQPGEYQENLLSENKSLVLGSEIMVNGDEDFIERTIIDGSGEAPVLRINGNRREDQPIEVRGFTIRNGFCRDRVFGGGISVSYYDPVILQDLIITGNNGGVGSALGGYWQAKVTVRRAVIRENRSTSFIIAFSQSTSWEFEDCKIIDNILEGGGTVFYGIDGNVAFRRVLFANNTAAVQIYQMCQGWPADYELDHLTLIVPEVEDRENPEGFILDMIEPRGDADLLVTNSIIAGSGNRLVVLNERANTELRAIIDYCDIIGGCDAITTSGDLQFAYGDGNIDADPLFRDPDNGDYRLTADSPCIDAGDPESPDDPDGTRADMGAFYYQPNQQPEVVAPIDDVVADEDCGYLAIADLDTVFTDPDEDSLAYQVTGPDQLGLTIDEAGVLGLEPTLNFNGDSLMVTLLAFDAEDTTSMYFMVSVNPVNDAPMGFGLVTPENGSTRYLIDGRYVTFSWERSFDPDSGAGLRYNLQGLFTIVSWNDPGHPESYDTLVINEILEDTIYLFDLHTFLDNFRVDGTGVVWQVSAISQNDTVWCDTSFNLHIQFETSVREGDNVPAVVGIHSLYPNPFNSSVTILFTTGIPPSIEGGRGGLSLRIYDLSGRLVTDLTPAAAPPRVAAEHSVVWNAQGLPGGIYLIRLESGSESRTIKTVLMK